MLYAVVERNPRFWGKVKSFDDMGAKAVRGVMHVLPVKMKVFSQDRISVKLSLPTQYGLRRWEERLKVKG
jgi:isoquinoline 1-oxidoreductase beta subunit